MPDLPKISILLLSYMRTKATLTTIQSTCENLGYPKELRSWYLCDDGSPAENFQEAISMLSEENILGYHNKRMRHEGQEDTYNCGKGYNLGLGICHQNSDLVLVLENDWQLDNPLDLFPYVKLLTEREDVGAVSFRILSVGTDVHTVGYDGLMYLKYLRTTQYAYSGNPMLRHARFTTAYGWFAEDRNPGLVELHMDDQYRLRTGPDIIRPLDISVWGAWKHTGTEKSWK